MSCVHSHPYFAAELDKTKGTQLISVSETMSIAVGTVIADRPPRRSVRDELRHTAPPSRQTIALLSNDTCRGHRAAPSDARSGTESGTSTAIRQLFPSVTSFPRRAPPLRSQFCSAVVDGTTKSSDFPTAFMPTLPSERFVGRSRSEPPSGFAPEADGISRFSRLECPRMHRVSDSAVFDRTLPITVRSMWPSP